MDIEKVSDLDNLYKAFKEACKESKWKASVQKYDIDLLLNLVHTKDSLLDGTYKQEISMNLLLMREVKLEE